MDKKYIPVLYFLSVWIVIYSYLYIAKLFRYNPIILLYIAIGFYIINIGNIAYNNNENSLLFYYIFINTLLKIPPLLLIYNDNIDNNDVIFSVIFIIIYVVFMTLISEDIICIYKNYTDFIINKNNGIMDEIYYYIKQIE
tara:strand:+ start:6053 stop:6472 length:420 start_codon:yes stop_codon:yes gene_type:complete